MKKENKVDSSKDTVMPLNKFLAISGICSRRNAAEFIKDGHVEVNGVVVKEPGHKVSFKDKIKFKNKLIRTQKKVYLLLNKPKDYIATVLDERGRRSVIDLVKGVVSQRVYPVGRLDRFTTGLILITNDGELSQNLAHPSFEVKKVYNVVLDQNLKGQDLLSIKKGVALRDGFVKADRVYYIPGKNRKHVRIQLHSGKNRVVRRIFKKFGYNVVKLDRINYAGLTKRGLPVGRSRFLKQEEIKALKKYGEIKAQSKKTRQVRKVKKARKGG
ncbi:pseudouridine synthase [Candidatus Dependentiae bacterium]